MHMIKPILVVFTLLLLLSHVQQAAANTVLIGVVTPIAGSYTNAGSVDGVGSTARFFIPYGVALSSDGTFALVADTGNKVIRKIDLATQQVTTLAGKAGEGGTVDGIGAAARFYEIEGMTLSHDDRFALVADGYGSGVKGSIRKIDIASGTVTTLVGPGDHTCEADGVGASAVFNYPIDVALSSDDAFALVADYWGQTVRKIVLATRTVTTLAGSPCIEGDADAIGSAARFRSPNAVALSPDNSFALVADKDTQTIRKIDIATGEVTTLAGAPGIDDHIDGVGSAARFANPTDVELSRDGTFALVVDHAAVRSIDLATNTVTTLADSLRDGYPPAGWNDPTRISLSDDGHFALVSDVAGEMIWRMDIKTLQQVYIPIVRN